jgi:hypothetical protein
VRSGGEFVLDKVILGAGLEGFEGDGFVGVRTGENDQREGRNAFSKTAHNIQSLSVRQAQIGQNDIHAPLRRLIERVGKPVRPLNFKMTPFRVPERLHHQTGIGGRVLQKQHTDGSTHGGCRLPQWPPPFTLIYQFLGQIVLEQKIQNITIFRGSSEDAPMGQKGVFRAKPPLALFTHGLLVCNVEVFR